RLADADRARALAPRTGAAADRRAVGAAAGVVLAPVRVRRPARVVPGRRGAAPAQRLPHPRRGRGAHARLVGGPPRAGQIARPGRRASVDHRAGARGRLMAVIGRPLYDLMYRIGAPWEGADRVELRALVRDGRCAPEALRRAGAPAARAVDLGCGSGG